MAASCSPSSGREPPKPKQSNDRKAAEEDARDEENNATKTFKEALQKDKRLRVKKRKAGGHSVAKNNTRNTTKDNEWRTDSSRAKLEE